MTAHYYLVIFAWFGVNKKGAKEGNKTTLNINIATQSKRNQVQLHGIGLNNFVLSMEHAIFGL